MKLHREPQKVEDPYKECLELAAKTRYHFHSNGSLCADINCTQDNYNTPDPFQNEGDK